MAPRIWNAKFLPARRSSIGKTEWIFIGCSTCAMQSRCLLSRKSVTVLDRKSTRLNSSHDQISYAVFCLKKKKNQNSVRLIGIVVITMIRPKDGVSVADWRGAAAAVMKPDARVVSVAASARVIVDKAEV